METEMTNTYKLAIIASEDQAIKDQISGIILKHNYSVVHTKSALNSILKILEKQVDLLVVDLAFQENSSLDLIKILKRMRPRLPIIVLSDDFSLDTVRKFIESGVFYCAMKPIQICEIENVLEAVMRYYKKHDIGTTA